MNINKIFCYALLALLIKPDVALAEVDIFSLSLQELLNIKVDVVSSFSEAPTEAAASLYHIEAKEWQQFGAFHNSDAFAMSPSLMVLHTTGDSVAIRGYATTLSRRGIATLIDGISVNDIAFGSSQNTAENISLGVADSIDIIRGPASVQYGTDAFHGVLAFKTYYREEADNKLTVQLGSEGESRLTWHYSQPLGDNNFFNIAIDKLDHSNDKREHWVYGYNGITGQPKRLDREENHDIGSALFKWHNSSEKSLQYQLSVLYNNTYMTGLPGGGSTTGYSDADEVGSISENTLAKFKFTFVASPQYEQGITAYYQHLHRTIQFQFNVAPPPLVGDTLTSYTKEGGQLFSRYTARDNSFRLSSTLEYSKKTIDEAVSYFSLLDGTQFPPSISSYDGFERSVTSLVLKGRKTIKRWDLDIELGGRIDSYSDVGSQKTPSLALIKRLGNEKLLKVIYGESFRAPTAAELEGSSIVKGSQAINPEILKSLEVVYSQQFDNLFFQITAYKNEWEEGIVLVDIVDPIYSREYQNIADNSSYGLELSLLYKNGPWQLNSDLSYSKSKDELNDIDYSAYPRYIWNTRATYDLSQDQSFFLSQRILHDMTIGHNTLPNEDLSTYIRYDMGYEQRFSPNFKINLTLKNVANRELWTPNVDNGPVGIIDDPLTLYFSVNYSFNQ